MERNQYPEKLIRRKYNGLIKVITGIRRSVKSYLLFDLFYHYLLKEGVDENHMFKIALDDRINKKYRDPEMIECNSELHKSKSWLVDKKQYKVII